jgi:hypothetical protein
LRGFCRFRSRCAPAMRASAARRGALLARTQGKRLSAGD